MAFLKFFVIFSQILGGIMLKICAFLLLAPLSVFAQDPCTQASCEKVFHIRENHPKLQGLEVQLEDGRVITLSEFLNNISDEDNNSEDIVMLGGEVPWPIVDPDEKKEDSEDD